MAAYGLIAGLRYGEMLRMGPGLIMDLYVYRRDYDDMEHGIRRTAQEIYD